MEQDVVIGEWFATKMAGLDPRLRLPHPLALLLKGLRSRCSGFRNEGERS